MNDTELDDMLNKWDAPPVPRGLRERISQEPSRRKFRFRLPSGLIFGLAAGAAMFLLAVGIASPQSFGHSIPFTVDTEVIDYQKDGSSHVYEYATRYIVDGREMTLSSSFPGDPLRTAHMNLIGTVGRLLYQISSPFRDTSGTVAARAMRIKEGCVLGGSIPIGKETILNHETTIIQIDGSPEKVRFTQWMAPDLSCFTLKFREEKVLSDGTFRLTSEWHALKITMYH